MISREEVLKLAELARLKVSEDEVASLQKDISNILEYVGQVSAISAPQGDIQGLTLDQGSSGLNILRNVMRDDVSRSSDDVLAGKEEALRSAFPTREGGYNVVRKIIQKDE